VEPTRPTEPPVLTQPPTIPTAEPTLPAPGFAALTGETVGVAAPNMIGDQIGLPSIGFLPGGPFRVDPRTGRIIGPVAVPSVRSFQICENESPRPQDRVYLSFSYFDEVNKAINSRFQADFRNVQVYRGTLGLEKTFLDGDASIGFRLPFDSLSVDSGIPGVGGTDTGVGDLTVILKYAPWQDPASGDVFAVGLAITAPTGPDTFADTDLATPFHNTIFHPYLGYICYAGDWFIHGFSAIDIPVESDDVTLLQNNIGLGYYLYRNPDCGQGLTAVVPTFEVHVYTPLNHRGVLDGDLLGAPDWVDLTFGITFEFHRQATLALACATPVTGPRPFSYELMAQLNWRFGGPRAAPLTP
jgi:hypothetical protein